MALELFGGVVMTLIGVAFLATSVTLIRRSRAFAASAQRTRLRVDRVDARASGRKQAGRNTTYAPHFEVLDGPHSGTIAQTGTVSRRWRGTEGRIYDGWFDPRTASATTKGGRALAILMLPVSILLGFGLVWYGISIITEELR